MQTSPSQTLTTHKKVRPSKLVLGFLAAAITAIIGASGVAGAQANNGSGGAGYGGDVNVDLNIEGNNNNVVIIIRYMFGG